MNEQQAPLVLINAVGLTTRWLEHAPRLKALADRGWKRSLRETIPAVTCSAQATILTGKPPSGHGIVGNGWLFRETGEVRFWQQSNRLLGAEPFYETARKRSLELGWKRPFTTAKLFWWFNQGACVDFSITPKPYYGADGKKEFGVSGTPESFPIEAEKAIGVFPFHTFWGPRSGLPCTRWIAESAAFTLKKHRPHLTMAYLPHLDYDPQRYGPSGCDMPRLVRELDDACAVLLDEAEKQGARVWVVSEYGHCDVNQPILINQILRQNQWLIARNGPFGETLETFQSRAFAVCDHQLAHIYINHPDHIKPVQELVASIPGVAQTLIGSEREAVGLDHPRSGEIIALSTPNAWFAYPYWLDERNAPDFARTVDIHRKPGYDPCELLIDPQIRWPTLKIAHRLIKKKLGFRMLMNLIPLDPTLIKGSHGLAASDDLDRPILIGDGKSPESNSPLPLTDVRDLILNAFWD